MLPTKDEISRAIEDISNISIPQLHGYQPCEGIIGPESYAGGFCIVFPFTNGYDQKAVRVWHQEIDRGQERYSCIANDFAKTSSRFLCDLRYYPSSLNVFNNKVDVVVMDWVKGKPLKDYIQSLIDNGSDANVLLADLAEESKNMFRELHSLKFSHGDLQHDNLIITEYGRIKLVDYDSFYTPSLNSGFIQTTTGYNGYQHPSRFLGDIESNEKIDYFSELIIYLSLKALSNDISLWKYAKDSDYSFLFDSKDFQDIEKSPVYNSIYSMGEEMQILLRILKEYLEETDINKLECFEELYNRYVTPPTIKSFKCSNISSIYIDDEIELIWDVEAYSKLTINGKDVTNQKSYKLKASNIDQFELVASNGLKDAKSILSIKIYKKPTIKFKANRTKLKKGKNENVRFTWTITNASSCLLEIGGVERDIQLIDEYTKSFDSGTNVQIIAIGLDGIRRFTKTIKIYVFNESEVEFIADKYYSLPEVPIQLSWNVSHAKEVELVGNGKVDPVGSIVVSPKETTVYSLKVTDAFGTNEHQLKVQMLPVPYVKALNIPTPEFNNSLNINLTIPTPELNTKFPNVEVLGVELNAPFVASLSELELDTKLTKRIEKQVNLWADIKSLYSYYRNKILSHER